jgi:uncharacterized protein YbgA (DUF1722 family)
MKIPTLASPSVNQSQRAFVAERRQDRLSDLVSEMNARLDNVLRNQNATPEQREKVEILRRQFNQQMMQTDIRADWGKTMETYRSARRELSDALTTIFGGPRPG